MQSEEKWLWLFEWFEMTGPGVIVRESIWMCPVLEAVHLLGLCLLGGTVLLVDLRLSGLTMRGQSTAVLAAYMRPWLLTALGTLMVTGVLLFLSEAVKCYYNQSFWVKMVTLPVALAFTFLVRERFVRNESRHAAITKKAVAFVSLALWFTVAAAGRWIGFS